MNPEAFTNLCGILQGRYGLEDSRNISLEESVSIFLIICAQNDMQHDISRRCGHSQETIHQKFPDLLNAMVQLAIEYIRPRTAEELIAISNRLERETKYWPYFNGFIGALDGTHVLVMVTSGREGLRFINSKGSASLNVLDICDFDMFFTYTFFGMAGSAHDARVLATATRDDLMFPVPPKSKYYLIDSGYANSRGYLAPYRKGLGKGTRYHLQEFFNREPPWNSKEMFNKLHASLRSVIERTFGVWKKKWKVLNKFPRYDIATQRNVIFATKSLYNFIRQHNFKDSDFDNINIKNNFAQAQADDDEDNDDAIVEEGFETGAYMRIVRVHIAEQIWSENQRRFRHCR